MTKIDENGKKAFWYHGLDTDGYQSKACSPIKVKMLMTKEQATKFAQQYKKWWKVMEHKEKLECKVVSLNTAIKHYTQWMEEKKSKMSLCSTYDFNLALAEITITKRPTSYSIRL